MADLTHRTEQAVLGALIIRPRPARASARLQAADFGDARHQAIFAALTGAVPEPRGMLARFRAWLGQLPMRGQIRDLRAYMDTLPGQCPDPDHLDAYARMVSQARRQREQAAQANPGPAGPGLLDATSAWLDQAARQAAQAQGHVRGRQPAGTPGPDLQRHVTRLAQGLGPRARPGRFSQGPAPVPRVGAKSAPENPGEPARNQPPTAGVTQDRPGQQQLLEPGDLQELVLADLMQRPAAASAVLAWLPPEMFTTGGRRHLYELISDRVAAGWPVDPLIVAWNASLSQDEGTIRPDDVLRIGALTAIPGTAAVLGRALLADSIITQRFGDSWLQKIRLHPDPPDPGEAPAGNLKGPAAQSAPATEERADPVAQPLRDTGSVRGPASAAGLRSAGKTAAAAGSDQVPLQQPKPAPASTGPVPRP
jgi:DnaB-like helicase N terminal domain